MGLLTTDKTGEDGTLATILKKKSTFLCFLCYMLAIASAIALITEQFVDKTYFSDNALLPGLVKRDFDQKAYLNEVLNGIKLATKDANGMPHDYLYQQFKSLGLDAQFHNYTLIYPFNEKQTVKGKNVYAILRAPRAPATEALVISAPFRSLDAIQSQTIPGIALMFALARYFYSQNYWAKDIVFLIGDQELLGTYAWLECYHEADKNNVLDYGFLPTRSGQIQGALNLEIHGQELSRLEIKIEGLNGQLPNLDIFNVAVELATRESVTATFHGRSHPFTPDPYELAREYALTTLSMMRAQSKNRPTGAHGLYHKYAIQAITLEGISRTTQSKESYLSVPLHTIGLVVEGIVRSLNNLLERFNRSYWFYLLPSTRRYISIGYYMIPFGFLIIPLALKAVSLFLTSDEYESESPKAEELSSFWKALESNFFAHLMGLVLCSVPKFFQVYSNLSGDLKLQFSELIQSTLIIISILFTINPLVPGVTEKSNKKAHRIVALLNLTLLLACVSLLNISLAFLLAIAYSPIALMIGGSYRSFFSTVAKIVSKVILIIIHPISLLYICLLLSSIIDKPSSSLELHLNESFSNHQIIILQLIEEWYIYGNVTYFLASAFLLPVWLQLWFLV